MWHIEIGNHFSHLNSDLKPITNLFDQGTLSLYWESLLLKYGKKTGRSKNKGRQMEWTTQGWCNPKIQPWKLENNWLLDRKAKGFPDVSRMQYHFLWEAVASILVVCMFTLIRANSGYPPFHPFSTVWMPKPTRCTTPLPAQSWYRMSWSHHDFTCLKRMAWSPEDMDALPRKIAVFFLTVIYWNMKNGSKIWRAPFKMPFWKMPVAFSRLFQCFVRFAQWKKSLLRLAVAWSR